LTFSMVWTIIIANIIVVAVSFIFLNHLARVTTIRGNLLIPFMEGWVFKGLKAIGVTG